MNDDLKRFLRSNVVPICLFPKKSEIQEYDVDFAVIGTGFNIATFGNETLVITASHLQSAFEETFDPHRHERSQFFPEAKKEDILFNLDEAQLFFDIGSPLCKKSDIMKSGLSDTFDIGFIHSKFRSENHEHLSQIAIDSRKLDVGREVFIFAYSDLKYTTGFTLNLPLSNVPFDQEDTMFHRFDGDMETIHEGKIIQVHSDFRSERYEVDIPVISGMSGGLVFYIDTPGKPIACGVISSSLADSSSSSDTKIGEGCFVTPIGNILNIPLIDNGEFIQYNVQCSDGKINNHEIKTLNDLVRLGVVEDVAVV
jgi:hypothetical protein